MMSTKSSPQVIPCNLALDGTVLLFVRGAEDNGTDIIFELPDKLPIMLEIIGILWGVFVISVAVGTYSRWFLLKNDMVAIEVTNGSRSKRALKDKSIAQKEITSGNLDEQKCGKTISSDIWGWFELY